MPPYSVTRTDWVKGSGMFFKEIQHSLSSTYIFTVVPVGLQSSYVLWVDTSLVAIYLCWTSGGQLALSPDICEELHCGSVYSLSVTNGKLGTSWSFLGLAHWGRDKMAAIFQTTFANAFFWMKMHEFRLRFHWNLFPRVQLTKFQHWFR